MPRNQSVCRSISQEPFKCCVNELCISRVLNRVVNQAQKDQAWLGMAREGYTFAAIVFFISCFAMSMLSRLAERQGAESIRRR